MPDAPDGAPQQIPEPDLHGPAAAAAAAAGTAVATTLGTPRGWRKWLRVYQLHMARDARRERLFLATFAFTLTFGVTRGLTLAIRHNVGPFHNVSVGGTHLHHLVWGILTLLVVGYISLVEFGSQSRVTTAFGIRVTAIAFGVGAALTLDEFALWLNLEDVYWQEKGRQSIDAVLVFGSLLAAGLFARPLIRGLAWEARAAMRGISEAERIAHMEYENMLHHRDSAHGQHPQQPIDGPT
ncbi:MAG: hypothetical protein ABR598_02085 [Candidatus Dormibacteria bacterium]